MKLSKVTIENFRSYSHRVDFSIEQITAIIGRNDIGKSSILDALDTFFKQSKLDLADRNIHAADNPVIIGCTFSNLPNEIVLDDAVSTTLEAEYLLNEDQQLEVRKEYSISGKESVFIVAMHPANEPYDNLLLKKNADLKRLIQSAGLQDAVNQTINSEMRHALWESLGDQIRFKKRDIPADKEDAKNIWQKILPALPRYCIFRADRPSTDDDAIAQDPMQIAMRAAIEENQRELMQIAENIKQRVSVVANQTIEKLKQFDETLASTLAPKFKKDPAWDKAFSFSLTGDEDIPINKRGSGVRRLILFSFFRASCEENLDGNSDVIYAVEEPETSQHPNFQQTIINTFLQMTENPHCQIIFTTHVPGLVKLVPVESLRYITNGEGYPEIETGTDGVIARIADSLGVLPDITPPLAPYRNIRLIVCVEGVNDILFLQTLTTALHKTQPEIRPILSCQDVMVLPMGGSSLQEWVNHNYLRKLGIPEYHIYDSDCVNAHQRECDIVNQRTDGSSARMTSRREMENYIHPDAIRKVYDADFEINDETDVPNIISDYLRVRGLPGCTQGVVKKKLNGEATRYMTLELLKEWDQRNEVLSWICDIMQLDIDAYI